jgi:hypothetical protein
MNVSTFVPILIIALWVVILFPLAIFEKTGFALLSVLVAGALLQVVAGYDVLGYIVNNPLTILTYATAYIVVGVGYTFLRWDRFGANWRKIYDATPDGYNKRSLYDNQPTAFKNKSRITNWMMFWPWSAFWWFLSDFILEVFNWVYSHFVTVYDRIMARHLQGLVRPPDPTPGELPTQRRIF